MVSASFTAPHLAQSSALISNMMIHEQSERQSDWLITNQAMKRK
jgi:hypothetical protein